MNQFKEVDANGDGKVSQEEFVNFFMGEMSKFSDEQFYDKIEFCERHFICFTTKFAKFAKLPKIKF